MKRVEGIFNKNSKGVFAISLVNSPATEETFIAMSKQEELVQFILLPNIFFCLYLLVLLIFYTYPIDGLILFF